MKLQAVTIIFSLIVVPVVLILGFFIQAQVDTISLQTSYDTKLLDATHDAMAALEINTANESLSSVADALRSIISASNNIFINALATNLGMSNASQSMIQPYIPAVLYTLYDGYYIYSPTKTPVVLSNNKGNAVTVGAPGTDNNGLGANYAIYKYTEPETNEYGEYINDIGEVITSSDMTPQTGYEEDYGQVLYKLDGVDGYTTVVKEGITEYKHDFVLKSFMPYSARYIGTHDGTETGKPVNIVINYTLDNYVIINGIIGDVYYSKSGYLIKNDLIEVSTNTGEDLLKYNEEKIEQVIDDLLINGNTINVTVNSNYKGQPLADGEKIVISIQDASTQEEKNAVKYYVKAAIFSNWVYTNLSGIKENDISTNAIENQAEIYKNMQNMDYNLVYDFQTSTKPIFNPDEDPEKDDSRFNVHKTAIIKNSIQYNLNVAMSAYNEMSAQAFSFNMPVISDDEWKQITSNISVVSFMQGFNCGLKVYNNYAIVPSTNNEFTVIPNEIFYVSDRTADDTGRLVGDMASTYHRIDCPEFTIDSTKGVRFFRSKEVKYDKIYLKDKSVYDYDHKYYSCYKCVINGNYRKAYFNGTDIVDAANGRYFNEIDMNALEPEKQKLYYIAVASERQNIYKSNAIEKSEGLQIFDVDLPNATTNSRTCTIGDSGEGSERPINEIKQIKVTISNIKQVIIGDPDNTYRATPVVEFNIYMNGDTANPIGINERLNTQTKEQTITLDIHSDDTSKLTNLTVEKVYPENEDITFFIKEIEIIYK